jgi:hypothetical protein
MYGDREDVMQIFHQNQIYFILFVQNMCVEVPTKLLVLNLMSECLSILKCQPKCQPKIKENSNSL